MHVHAQGCGSMGPVQESSYKNNWGWGYTMYDSEQVLVHAVNYTMQLHCTLYSNIIIITFKQLLFNINVSFVLTWSLKLESYM